MSSQADQSTSSSTVTVTSSITTSKPSLIDLRSETLESSSKILPSPATLHAITKEIENSFKESSSLESPNSPPSSSSISGISHRFTGSLNKISNAQQTTYKKSPSNSVKSNSAPGRVSSMDPQLSMNINKVTQGNFCVKPQDELGNRGEGKKSEEEQRKKSTTTIEDMERLNRMKSEISSGERLKFPGIGSNSLGNDTRYKSVEAVQQERRKSAGDEDAFNQLNVRQSLILNLY